MRASLHGFNQNQFLEDLHFLQSDLHALFLFPAVQGGSLCCCCFLMIYATETPQTHLREARETFLKTCWNIQNEWDVETNNREREREMKRGQTQTEFSMYVQAILYFAVIHYSGEAVWNIHNEEPSAGVTFQRFREGDAASLWARAAQPALSHNNLPC